MSENSYYHIPPNTFPEQTTALTSGDQLDLHTSELPYTSHANEALELALDANTQRKIVDRPGSTELGRSVIELTDGVAKDSAPNRLTKYDVILRLGERVEWLRDTQRHEANPELSSPWATASSQSEQFDGEAA